MIRAHHQMLMSAVIPVGPPLPNDIDAWFTGGGLGVYYHAHPYYCFTDAGGTTNAAVGDQVQRINCRGGSGFYLNNATAAQRPILRYDGTLGRYYLEFSTANAQRLGGAASSVLADWIWLHNGTEYQAVARAQYGTTSNPNAGYAIWATNQGSSSDVGASMFYDDRASVPRSDAQRHQVTRGSAPAPIDLAVQNVITPNTVAVVSQSYANAVSGNDCILRVAGSVTGGAETAIAPNTGNPNGRLTMGSFTNGAFTLEGRIYALAILRGTGSRANVTSYEAAI